MARKTVDEWRAREDADTLKRAEMVKLDRDRHGAAKQHLQNEKKAIDNITKPATVKPAGKRGK